MNYYESEIDEVFSFLKSSAEGLSSSEASERLQVDGRNELEREPGDPMWKKFLDQIIDPMIIMLLVAAAVSAVIAIAQNDGFADVIIILAVVVINAVLGVYQENKAESALEDLQKMSADKVSVIRGGELARVDAAELVVGDVVLLEAGDIVPADGRIFESASLKIEEAALTGESVAVNKCIEMLGVGEREEADSQDCDDSRSDSKAVDIPLADRKNMAYSGTTVVYGRGKMVVTQTGMDTEIGKIAGALSRAKSQQTPLQIKMAQLSKILTWIVVGICVVVFAVQLIRAGGFSFKFALDAFMIAVTLAVAAIPEGLPAIVTVVLSIGVTNMSKRNAIIRKLTAVETLGCAQIICSDKTGTLTQNKMTVVRSYGEDDELLACGMALCSDAEIDVQSSQPGLESIKSSGEPTEVALVEWAHKIGYLKSDIARDCPRVGEAPFDSNRKMMSTVHEVNDENLARAFGDAFGATCKSAAEHPQILQFTKGGVDVVLSRCTHVLQDGEIIALTNEERQYILAENDKFAADALRVLACAMRLHTGVPKSYDSEALENGLVFIGFVGMIDPVRPEVGPAIERCREAGIRPIMITGDQPVTAAAIARELGILQSVDVASVDSCTESTSDSDNNAAFSAICTGSELSAMSDDEFEQKFDRISVYARVQPEHKTRIVKAWQKAGYVVAMTGDGVNDAPSIKNADIGVGMGITGTDVTKNVADMVLADDNFASIVNAVEEGRTIYDNILKAIQFLLSSNFSEVFSVFFATLAGFTILKPVHLLWINLVTDTFPALSLGFEKSEEGIMKRPPRSSKDSIFANGMGFDMCYQGASVTILCIISYFVGMYIETGRLAFCDSAHGTTMAFLTMAMVAIFHSFNMRSLRGSIFKLKTQNVFLWISAVVSLILTTVVCEVPFLTEAFQFSPVGVQEYLIALGLGFCIIPIVEIVKLIQRTISR